MLFCTGALMLNPTLFKLAKPTGELRQSWFQIIAMFLLRFVKHVYFVSFVYSDIWKAPTMQQTFGHIYWQSAC